jgi:chromate reductase, NAD(P)H dehydrogenase (quinone)
LETISIAMIIGSLRKESLNRRLAYALIKLASPDFVFKDIDISSLPLYNQDDEAAPCEAVIRFREEVAACSGLLIVSPEYNRSLPGVLKNALDIGSRPFGKSVWPGKPAGIIGISNGALGTSAMQQHLRNVLTFLDVPTMNQPEAFIQNKEGLFTESGEIGEISRTFLQNWMNKYETWVKLHVALVK